MIPASPLHTGLSESLVGQSMGSCRLVRLIGQGGMGEVYEAVQESLNRRVAVKVLPLRLAQDASFVERFNRESGALAQLSHPNIVAIYDRGHEGEHYYLVLEFVAGKDGQPAPTLQQRLRSETTLTVKECARFIQQVAEALHYAHGKGVIHRDIKPSNILIEERGNARLVDFGIAHLAGGIGGETFQLTMTGDVLGSAGYLSPEQRQGQSTVDGRADVYSCGVILYEMLTGRMPEGMFEMPSELVPGLDVRWDAIVEKSLQRNPDRRFPTMGDFLRELQAINNGATSSIAQTTSAPVVGRRAKLKTETDITSTSIVGKCGRCGTVNSGDNWFCSECGASLYENCLACNAENRVGTKYCGKCGADVKKLKRVAGYRQRTAEVLTHAGKSPGIDKLPILAEAHEVFDKLLKDQPDDLDSRKSLDMVREKMRQLLLEKARNESGVAAMQTCRHALKLFPEDPEAQSLLDTLEQKLKPLIRTASELIGASQFQPALEHLEKAISEFGSDTSLLKLKNEATSRWQAQFMERARSQPGCEAIATYRDMLVRFPGHREAQARLGKLENALKEFTNKSQELLDQQKFELALELIEKGLEQFGTEAGLLALRAQVQTGVLKQFNQENQLLCDARKFVTLLQRLDGSPVYVKDREGDPEIRKKAIKAVRQAQEYTIRADQLLAAQKPNEALAECEKALEVCADCLQAKDGIEKARTEIEKARADIEKIKRAAALALIKRRIAVAVVVLVCIIMGIFWVSDRKAWARTQECVAGAGRDWIRVAQLYQEYLAGHPNGCGASIAAQEVKWLANAKGGLMLKTEPAGAAVTLGEEEVKTSPATFNGVKIGKYLLRMSLEGYESESREVEIKENNFTDMGTMKLIRRVGSIQLVSEPGGRYKLNGLDIGDKRGTTPALEKDLPTGQYTLIVRCGSWEQRKTVSVKRGKTSNVKVEFAEYPVAEKRWSNSLEQVFVPVAGVEVLFGIWDVRVKDYAVYAAANSGVDGSWKNPGFAQDETHPVVNVSWEDAQGYCRWLTEKERREGLISEIQSYRLPMDWEWSVAVGLNEPRSGTPVDKNRKINGVYPWGNQWPPPKEAGNYNQSLNVDRFAYTSPVGSFKANQYGLYDMGGDVWQWCEDWSDNEQTCRVLRGGSWYNGSPDRLLSSFRLDGTPGYRYSDIDGFRVVLVVGGSAAR